MYCRHLVNERIKLSWKKFTIFQIIFCGNYERHLSFRIQTTTEPSQFIQQRIFFIFNCCRFVFEILKEILEVIVKMAERVNYKSVNCYHHLIFSSTYIFLYMNSLNILCAEKKSYRKRQKSGWKSTFLSAVLW